MASKKPIPGASNDSDDGDWSALHYAAIDNAGNTAAHLLEQGTFISIL